MVTSWWGGLCCIVRQRERAICAGEVLLICGYGGGKSARKWLPNRASRIGLQVWYRRALVSHSGLGWNGRLGEASRCFDVAFVWDGVLGGRRW